jgi:cation diffusion facilitator family transporter
MLKKNIDSRIRYIRMAGGIALAGNLVLAALKLGAGALAGSLSVLGDGIDTAADVLIACITLVISRVIAQPSDKDHPWGHGRAETTATFFLSFIIFFSGAQLCLSSGQRFIGMLHGAAVESSGGRLAVIATLLSIAGKLLLSLSQFSIAKRAQSAMIHANAVNMRNDVIVSVAVLAGLGVNRFFGLPQADPVAAFLVGLWIIKNAVKIFFDANMELMDGTASTELYRKLFDAVKTVPGVSHPHRARIRRIASRLDIDLDIELSPDLTVREAHRIAGLVEAAIKEALPVVYDIMIHIEPRGGGHSGPDEEQYGLSEASLKE